MTLKEDSKESKKVKKKEDSLSHSSDIHDSETQFQLNKTLINSKESQKDDNYL